MEQFANRPIPDWYDDAKLGIMIHWGPSSVPGFAPRSGRVWDVPDQFKNNPYAEWYRNSLHIEGSPVQEFHAREFGAGFPYERFGEMFKAASTGWDPEDWAGLIQASGARYVVPTTKHHDGFLLWPSAIRNPHAPAGYASERDLIGELGQAVRACGLKFGLYYSGGIDWLFHDVVIRTLADLQVAVPRDPAYIDYAFAHWDELIDRYAPDLMWNDIFMPGPRERLEALFARYYEKVPGGVINDRFKMRKGHYDFSTPEYDVEAEIQEKKWECVRGIGFSFGYNRDETDAEYITSDALVRLLVDVVSKNGNLLLNFGPMADGTVPGLQRERLLALGAWLAVNGEGVYGTQPWRRPAGRTAAGAEVRFTRKGADLYAHVFASLAPGEAVLRDAPGETAFCLSLGQPVAARRRGADLVLDLPTAVSGPVVSFRLDGAA